MFKPVAEAFTRIALTIIVIGFSARRYFIFILYTKFLARQHFSPVSRDLFSKGLILGVSGSFLLIYEVHGKVEIVSLFVKEQVIDGLPL